MEADASAAARPEAEEAAPKRRRRWEDAPAAPGATPAIGSDLLAMAPALGSLVGAAAGGPPLAASTAPPPAAPIELDEEATRRAQEAIRRVSSMMAGGGAALAGLAAPPAAASSGLELDIDINDSPRKGQLTRKATQEEISKTCGVGILIRGRYKPPGDTSTDERPLHLHITATSQEALEQAEAMIREIMGPAAPAAVGATAEPLPAAPPPSTFVPGMPIPAPRPAPTGPPPSSAPPMHTLTLEVGVPSEQGYAVRGKLLGPKGAYVRHIQDTTGVRVQLSGQGSNNKGPDGLEAPHGLALSLNAPTPEALEKARQLAEHLIASVKEDQQRRQSAAVPGLPAPPSSLPTPPSSLPAPPSDGAAAVAPTPAPPGYPPAAAPPAYPGYPPPYGPPGYPPCMPPTNPYGYPGYPPSAYPGYPGYPPPTYAYPPYGYPPAMPPPGMPPAQAVAATAPPAAEPPPPPPPPPPE
jgi:hypothetical protein